LFTLKYLRLLDAARRRLDIDARTEYPHAKPNISTMISQISYAITRSLELDRNPKRGVDAPGAQGTRVRVRNIDAAPLAL
jgi:hypothetical protein